MADYRLCNLTIERLRDIRDSWESLAGTDEFAVEMSATFEWAEPRLKETPGDSQAFELRNEITGDAEALLEIINSSDGELTKLLTLYTSPAHWGEEDDNIGALAELYGGAFVEVLSRGMKQPTGRVVKVYGRDNDLLYILRQVKENWDKAESLGWNASMEGRWLAISRR